MSIEKDFVKPDDPILVRIADEILPDQITAPTTQTIVEKILDISYGHRKDRAKPTVVGLAAPQVGISKRIIAVDTGAEGHGGLSNLKIFINPQIIWKSEEEEGWCEGCWSTDKVCGVVSRPAKIKLSAFLVDGSKIDQEYQGYPARIIQHEVDHLNGVEFVNHITDDSKLHWVEDDQWTEYKKQEGWRNWPNKCPREKWEKIKGIRS